jgi:hypothetical protein
MILANIVEIKCHLNIRREGKTDRGRDKNAMGSSHGFQCNSVA